MSRLQASFRAASSGLVGQSLRTSAGLSQRNSINSIISQRTDGSDTEVGGCTLESFCTERLAISKDHLFRKVWSALVTVFLFYTGTILPARLCFEKFHIETGGEAVDAAQHSFPSPSGGWGASFWDDAEVLMDFFWYADFVIYFFFTFTDSRGTEVYNLRHIAVNYLSGGFWLNMIACMPEMVVTEVITVLSPQDDIGAVEDEAGGDGQNVQRLSRLLRIHKISRLARLAKLMRIVKVAASIAQSQAMRKFSNLRTVRILKFVVVLLWSVHLLACGWYLTAALEVLLSGLAPESSWVGRRGILQEGPWDQWLDSMYFVLTVFTTVGFGDMSASTKAEICYVMATMLIGAVVNSIIVSEVINIVQNVDKISIIAKRERELVHAFSLHTEIADSDPALARDLFLAIDASWMERHHFNREDMKQLLMSCDMPADLHLKLEQSVFDGQLAENLFLQICSSPGTGAIPPRLFLLVAVLVSRRNLSVGECVYFRHEHPFNVYLVLAGTFAAVDRISTGPRETGKISDKSRGWSSRAYLGAHYYAHEHEEDEEHEEDALYAYSLYAFGNYFGELELMLNCPCRATIRCESPKGSLAVLAKADFQQLLGEFPNFGRVWHTGAVRRERIRSKRYGNSHLPMTYKAVAVLVLQRFYRDTMRKKSADARCTASRELQASRAAAASSPETRNPTDATNGLRAEMAGLRACLADLQLTVKAALPYIESPWTSGIRHSCL